MGRPTTACSLRPPAASFRCRIRLCRFVRPEGNIIDLIRLNGGIRDAAAQFWKRAACFTYPPRTVPEEGKAYLLTGEGEPVSALVPIEDYGALLETEDIVADRKTMKDLAAALDDERRSRL